VRGSGNSSAKAARPGGEWGQRKSSFSLAGQLHARACLLDHAAELRDAVGELLCDEEVSVELAEQTLEQAARVWSREHD
jgi:hypothetical protein